MEGLNIVFLLFINQKKKKWLSKLILDTRLGDE